MANFLALHPLFGTKNNRKSLTYQQRSPYYWWWAYLRRNKEYLKCCESNGEGELATLYDSFGDVRQENFHEWWSKDQRGAKLFAEEQNLIYLKELKDKNEWNDQWSNKEVMVVAVPLNQSKRDLQRYFASLLKKRHYGGRGRIKEPFKNSNANFKLSRNFTIDSLRTALSIYDHFNEQNTARGKKMKLWEVGVEKRLMLSMMPNENDTRKDTSYKRNVLAAAVKRYLNQAEKSIANTGLGIFP